MKIENNNKKQIVLIGAGIMSATFASLIHNLLPDVKLVMYERLDKAGAESSDAWNNAGTGHAAYCELNYTPQAENGTIDTSKAISISEQYEISKQYWSYLIKNHQITFTKTFITQINHMSFVSGDNNVAYLKKRFELLTACPLFEGMEYTEDLTLMKEWFPLMMEGRPQEEACAATSMSQGTDVNFGQLTRAILEGLMKKGCLELKLNHQVNEIRKTDDKQWAITVEDLSTHKEVIDICDFIFIGAGGGSLLLLEKTDIPEAEGYGGFPIGGQWLRCTNKEVIASHNAKVYGKAAVGAPPMSVPHLDTRFIDGQQALLFGPYASFSTKFLKEGSYIDLFLSIESHNLWSLISAGLNNIPLTKYLIEQVSLTHQERMEELRKFYPHAMDCDWELVQAGQRVQVIKKENGKGVLKFGTEVVCNEEGSIATLLGASPGASTSVSIMLDVILRCFPEAFKSSSWQSQIAKMIPSYGKSLSTDRALIDHIREDLVLFH